MNSALSIHSPFLCFKLELQLTNESFAVIDLKVFFVVKHATP